MRPARIALAALFLVLAGAAHAVQPDEILPDAAQEARARALSAELRCMVCQNQSIDDSDAGLARDIRVLIRERISKGESSDSVKAFLVSRYGDFILLKPPFKPGTYLLWLSAPIALLLGALAMIRSRLSALAPEAPLDAQERARLETLLANAQESAPPHR